MLFLWTNLKSHVPSSLYDIEQRCTQIQGHIVPKPMEGISKSYYKMNIGHIVPIFGKWSVRQT
jgi:hypothetical protein